MPSRAELHQSARLAGPRMDAPQSPADIQPIEAALRLIEDRLRIVWNPEAELVRPGYIDANGVVGTRVYDGRWEVWLTGNFIDNVPTLLWTWGTELGPARPYRAIDWSIVDFFRTWDSANRNVIAEHIARRDAYERADAVLQAAREAEGEEIAARFATDVLGAKHLIGTGTAFSDPPSATPPVLH